MPHLPPRTGVCLIRVEAQRASLLITVRRNPDISRLSSESEATFSDTEAALAAVRGFLEQFITEAPHRVWPKSWYQM